MPAPQQQQYSDIPPGAVVLHAPAAQQYSDLPEGATVLHAPASDVTSNPNGEGTYAMRGQTGGIIKVPFSKIGDAQSNGLQLQGPDAGRYQKDFGATQHPVMDYINSKFANNPGEGQPGGYDEALRPVGNIGRRAVRDIAESVKGLGDSLLPDDTQKAGEAQFHNSILGRAARGESTPAADIMADTIDQVIPGLPAGSYPLSVARTAKHEGVTQAATDVAGDALAMYAGGKAVSAIHGALSSAPPVSGQNYTKAHAAAFEGAIAPATSMGKNFIPQQITTEALSPIRDTAARMSQGSPIEQGIVKVATDSNTPPLERVGAYQKIVKSAIGDLEAQHAPALAQAASIPVDTTGIVQRLQGRISPTTAPADTAAIQELIGRVKQAKTIGDLNTFRQELNDETSPQYRMSQVQAGRTGVSAEAANDLTGWVRNAYYDNLEQATGQDYAPLKRQESNLFTTQEALQNQQSPLAKAEATFAAPTTLKEKAGNVANVIKDPKTTVTQTFLRESPATKVSTLLRKSLDDLPTTGTPAAAAPPPTTPQQPGGTAQPTLGTGQQSALQSQPAPTPAAPLAPRGLPSSYSRFPQRLPASTAGPSPTPASPPPPLNEATAGMRVQPTQFAPRPTPAQSSGPLPVAPDGQVGVPSSRYLGAGTPDATEATPARLTGKALWAKTGAERLATHGVSAADIDTLNATPKGKQLLVIASSLSPGSQAMKNLVRQISGIVGK